MIFAHIRPMVDAAELLALSGHRRHALKTLRELPLYDFGMLLLRMPDQEFPGLSSLLPRTADPHVQQDWAGDDGFDLLRKTLDFCTRLPNYTKTIGGFPIEGTQILDYGCGFGRLARIFPYFTDPKCPSGRNASHLNRLADRA